MFVNWLKIIFHFSYDKFLQITLSLTQLAFIQKRQILFEETEDDINDQNQLMKHVVASGIIQLLKLNIMNTLLIRVKDNVSENLQQKQNKNLCMNDADLMYRRDQ
ncbi:Hypothetical_protein [Hexamita inflata]|uniref:Hypothetical_protein n=1 Tax=Hexamita inflata TaxID=28002 RepID=A0AA86N9F2_9EUKA|nr:Hypothetical protein HINF_LOCUS2768 [Hexamita inflata]